MASDDFEHHESGGLPWQPIDFYRERINEMSVTDVDLLIALEELIAKDLNLADREAAIILLSRTDFLERVQQIRDSEHDDQGRIVAEMFSMAPVLWLWPVIRDTYLPEEAHAWLRGAVDLALSDGDIHNTCASGEYGAASCYHSPYCPKKMVAGTLTQQAMQTPSDLELILGNPERNLAMVRGQLELGVEKGLFTKERAGALTQSFYETRNPKFDKLS
jgi:hypothetical protein